MLFRTQSAAVYGIDANLVDVEVDLTPIRNETDTPASVIIVGLPDLAVRESRERIRAAINNSAFFFPFQKTTINLAPADVRKEGASFDLPIALRARQSQARHLLLPDENAKEAAVVSEVKVYAVTDLRSAVEMIAAIRSDNPPAPIRPRCAGL